MSGLALAQSDVARATNKAALNKLSVQLKKRAMAEQKLAKEAAKRNGWPVRQELSDGTVIEIQRLSPTGMPVFYITTNAIAAETVSTDKVHPGGVAGLSLDGTGMTVGLWDEARVLGTHAEFTGRVTQKAEVPPPTVDSLHATHVAGTMIATGVNPAAKGMAYNASLDAYDWNSDAGEMAAAAAVGQLLSNHSYGNATGWLLVDPFALPPCQIIDPPQRNHPIQKGVRGGGSVEQLRARSKITTSVITTMMRKCGIRSHSMRPII